MKQQIPDNFEGFAIRTNHGYVMSYKNTDGKPEVKLTPRVEEAKLWKTEGRVRNAEKIIHGVIKIVVTDTKTGLPKTNGTLIKEDVDG